MVVSARALLHLAASAALLTALLLIPDRETSQAYTVLALTGGLWLAATVLRLAWNRSPARGLFLFPPLSPDTASVFLLLSSATYTTFAIELVAIREPVPAEHVFTLPPGLFPDFLPYYLAVHAAVVVFISLYGQTRDRALHTALTVQLVYSSILFMDLLRFDVLELFPRGTLLPILWANVLVMLSLFFTSAHARERGATATPYAFPVAALLAIGLAATIRSIYVHQSLVNLLSMAAFIAFAWVLANSVWRLRDITLFSLAVVLPILGVVLIVILQVLFMADVMGVSYALRNRVWFPGIAGPASLGLAVALAVILLLGAVMWLRTWRQRVAAGALLVPVVFALLAVGSLGGIAGAVGGSVALAVARFSRELSSGLRVITVRRVLATGLVTLVAVAVLAFPARPVVAKYTGIARDPTGGLVARMFIWELVARDFAHNPVLGTGLGISYGQSRYLPEFPYREVTRLNERASLVRNQEIAWRSLVITHPHSLPLAVAEGMGILGLGAFLWLLGLAGREYWRLVRRGPTSIASGAAAAYLAAAAGLLVWSTADLGQHPLPFPTQLWILLSLAVGSARLSSADVEPTEKEHAPGWSGAFLQRVTAWRIRLVRPSQAARFAAGALVAVLALAFLALVARPIAAEAYAKRGQESLAEGNASQAGDQFHMARVLDPLNGRLIQLEGAALLAARSYQEALPLYQDLVATRRDDARSRVQLGWVYWLNGDSSAALQEFEAAAALDPWNGLGSDNLTALGLAYSHTGRRDEAVEVLKSAIRVDSGQVKDVVWRLSSEGGATSPILDPAYLAPPSAGVDLTSRILHRLRVPGHRRAAFVNVDAESVGVAPIVLTDLLEEMVGDYQRERVFGHDPERAAGMLFNVARAYEQRGMLGVAARLLRELSALEPDESYASFQLGRVYRSSGLLEAAIEQYQQSAALAEGSRSYEVLLPYSQFELGQVFLTLRRADLSVAALEEAYRTYRFTYLDGLLPALSRAYELAGRPDDAVRALQREIFLNGRPSTYRAIGDLYERIGDREKADYYHRKAVEVTEG